VPIKEAHYVFRLLVKTPADTVASQVSDHLETMGFGGSLNSLANSIDWGASSGCDHSVFQRLLRCMA